MRYGYKIKNYKYANIKLILLGLCFLCLLIVLAGIISAISSQKYFDILWYGIFLVVIIGVQISLTFLTYELIIVCEDDKFIVSKKYPMFCKTIIDSKLADIKLAIYDKSIEKNKDKNIICLYINTCSYDVYMIELSGKKYLINLDEYMNSLIEAKNGVLG